ncbi:MAG TPA: YgiQ family radical SAM protein [Bacteroidales bacterium]|nr:YgiQ family radical SAM protein [Bacteroidales bacterium]
MKTTPFIPITAKEVEDRGWKQLDVILISGDAYIDHPSFGVAVIARMIEKQGLKVAIIPQPNWKDDLRDFKKFGAPRLFFGITAGNMDSMVNHYTASKRIRKDDAYTPGNQAGFRPDNATIVYSNIVRKLFPETPIIIGGVEASMRRLAHYDYWADQFRPSILLESKADLLVYGMGEKPIIEICKAFKNENPIETCRKIQQVAFLCNDHNPYVSEMEDLIVLKPYEKEFSSKKVYAENFVTFEKETNKRIQRKIIQKYNEQTLVINPPFPPLTESEMDQFSLFDVMMNAPHPKYTKRGDIPAFEMIKNSITIHRGCFGGCSFCAIAAHQGKFISSRSEQSVLIEVKDLTTRPYFKGFISDLGGPSANMYKMEGINLKICNTCSKPSCIYPSVCSNLSIDHKKLIQLYQSANQIKNIKKITIGSGIRYDMLIAKDFQFDKANHLSEYLDIVVENHVSGRLKVAPEHTSDQVLKMMRKPSFSQFELFYQKFAQANKKFGLHQQLIPYFISSHPGCTLTDMAELAIHIKQTRSTIQGGSGNPYGLDTDHVQDFTPTPMTYATAIYYLGFDPYTGKSISVANTIEQKKNQNLFFFYHKKENHEKIQRLLKKINRIDLLNKLKNRS